MRGAASSGSDQAQEQARSGGRILHTTEDGTLRLTEKASSCRQVMGHRRWMAGVTISTKRRGWNEGPEGQVPNQGRVDPVPGRAMPRPLGQQRKVSDRA